LIGKQAAQGATSFESINEDRKFSVRIQSEALYDKYMKVLIDMYRK
jgi:hypothetical protein